MQRLDEVDGVEYFLTGHKVHSLDGSVSAEFIGTNAVGHITEKRVPPGVLSKARAILKGQEV